MSVFAYFILAFNATHITSAFAPTVVWPFMYPIYQNFWLPQVTHNICW